MTPEQRERLDTLVAVPEGARQSPLDRLRDGPYIQSGPEISRALTRLDEIRVITEGLPEIDRLPPGRINALARFASAAKAQAVARLPDDRRTATLLAFIRTLEASASDDVIDLFDVVTTTIFSNAQAVSREVVNIIVLWNTIYMDATLNQLRAEGYEVKPEDVAHLSPLSFGHINMLGRYAFTLPEIIARGELRPLRDPRTAGIDDL